jgi:hypothetical protein
MENKIVIALCIVFYCASAVFAYKVTIHPGKVSGGGNFQTFSEFITAISGLAPVLPGEDTVQKSYSTDLLHRQLNSTHPSRYRHLGASFSSSPTIPIFHKNRFKQGTQPPNDTPKHRYIFNCRNNNFPINHSKTLGVT